MTAVYLVAQYARYDIRKMEAVSKVLFYLFYFFFLFSLQAYNEVNKIIGLSWIVFSFVLSLFIDC